MFRTFYGENSLTVALNTKKVRYSRRLWPQLQILFQLLFSLAKRLNVAIVKILRCAGTYKVGGLVIFRILLYMASNEIEIRTSL
jgi:hypothetical protein